MIAPARKEVHHLEYDPVTQFKFHFFWTWTWFIILIIIPFVPTLYAHSLSALIIQEVSMWANFVSHFTAMSASLAAIFADGRQSEVKGLALIKKNANSKNKAR